jgi:hypothetical protein
MSVSAARIKRGERRSEIGIVKRDPTGRVLRRRCLQNARRSACIDRYPA